MPLTPEPQPPKQEVPTVAIALIVGGFMVVAFFGLIAIVIPGAVQMGGAMLLLIAFFAAQYFVWGRRLHAYVVKQERLKNEAHANDDSPGAE
ncbi:MAG: hypothetical protein R3C19_08955 [Planctomycetaceae bacterium]